jgi:hypothetical protein
MMLQCRKRTPALCEKLLERECPSDGVINVKTMISRWMRHKSDFSRFGERVGTCSGTI